MKRKKPAPAGPFLPGFEPSERQPSPLLPVPMNGQSYQERLARVGPAGREMVGPHLAEMARLRLAEIDDQIHNRRNG